MNKRSKITLIAGIVISLACFSFIYTYSMSNNPKISTTNNSEIEAAKKIISTISGTEIENISIDERFKTEDLNFCRITDTIFSYKYDLVNERITTMRSNFTDELYKKEKDTSKFNETNAIQTAQNNIAKYNSIIKNPILFKCDYENARNHYIIAFLDQITPGFTTGNSIGFEISNEGDIIAISNHFEDLSVTQNINYSNLITKEKATNIMLTDDELGFMKSDDLEITLTSYNQTLTWELRSISSPIHVYRIDAKTGSILYK